jgi:hypothetical protein
MWCDELKVLMLLTDRVLDVDSRNRAKTHSLTSIYKNASFPCADLQVHVFELAGCKCAKYTYAA